MKIRVELGMMIRFCKKVVVEVPDDFATWSTCRREQALAEVYEADDGEGFVEDSEYPAEEAGHFVLSREAPKYADYVVREVDGRLAVLPSVPCDECGALIPGDLEMANPHHEESCSLHEP